MDRMLNVFKFQPFLFNKSDLPWQCNSYRLLFCVGAVEVKQTWVVYNNSRMKSGWNRCEFPSINDLPNMFGNSAELMNQTKHRIVC